MINISVKGFVTQDICKVFQSLAANFVGNMRLEGENSLTGDYY